MQQRTNLKSKATQTGVSLSLQPTQINATANQGFTVDVFAIVGDYRISAAEIHISFDPDMLEVRNIRAGSALPVILREGQVVGNQASITVGVNPDSSSLVTGVIATLTMIPKSGLTSATIQFTNQTMVSAINRQENVVGSLNPATITQSSASPSVSPSPSASPSLSPSPTISPTPTLSPSSSSPPTSTVKIKTTPSPTSNFRFPSAVEIIEQKKSEGIRRLASTSTPQPTTIPEGVVVKATKNIPVIGGVIIYFVTSFNNIINFWNEI